MGAQTLTHMKWWIPIVVPLVTLATSMLFGHAWVLSEYLIHPGCCRDLLPSRAAAPAYAKYTIVPFLEKLKLRPEPITFPTFDDPANPSRGAVVSGYLMRSKASRGGVVLVHDAGSDLREVLPLVRSIISFGYNCLTIQSQEATHTRTYLGLVAQYDVLAAVHQLKELTDSAKIVTMGIGEGAAAALFAAQQSMEVDAVIAINMHSESDELMQERARVLMADVKQLSEVPPEHPALKAVVAAGLLFLDEQYLAPTIMALSSHIAVIRSSTWLTWLHGHADPLKGIHRLQPRGLFLVQGKTFFGGSTLPIQKIYHRAGLCSPKLANLPELHSDPASLSADAKYKNALGSFLENLTMQ